MSAPLPAGPVKGRRRGLWLLLMTGLLVLSFVAAVACNFFANLAECGISGCSGGGFGIRSDPQNPVPWRIISGIVLVLPIALVPHWLRWQVRLPVAAVVAGAWIF